jgi:hypothetical protein
MQGIVVVIISTTEFSMSNVPTEAVDQNRRPHGSRHTDNPHAGEEP